MTAQSPERFDVVTDRRTRKQIRITLDRIRRMVLNRTGSAGYLLMTSGRTIRVSIPEFDRVAALRVRAESDDAS